MILESNYINTLKERLKNKEILVKDLSEEDVKILKKEFEEDIENHKKELEEINNRIKNIKVKIDNWNNV